MARSDDDDALDWGDGSDDPTYVGAREVRSPRRAGSTADPDDADLDLDDAELDPVGAEAGAPDAAPAPSSGSALLVVYGVFAGVYLLYTIGWIIGVQRDPFTSSNLFFEVMYQFGEFLAIVSPALWFGVTLLLTRHRTAIVRMVWLVLGMIVVAPLPFLLSGSAT